MRTPKVLVAMISLAVPVSCARSDADATATFQARSELRAAALGCWTLVDANAQPIAGRFGWVPPVVRLDSAIVFRGNSSVRRSISRLDMTGRELPRYLERGIDGLNEWTADARSDTIRLMFNNAFSGSIVYLHLPSSGRSPDTLLGRAVEFSDDGPSETPRGAVRAYRISCPRTDSSASDGI